VHLFFLGEVGLDWIHEGWSRHLGLDMLLNTFRPEMSLLYNAAVPLFEKVVHRQVGAKEVTDRVVPLLLDTLLLQLFLPLGHCFFVF